jgi:hypothetical protein
MVMAKPGIFHAAEGRNIKLLGAAIAEASIVLYEGVVADMQDYGSISEILPDRTHHDGNNTLRVTEGICEHDPEVAFAIRVR